MRITSLSLPSFKAWRVAGDLPLTAKRIYIAGENGAGKSSLGRDAIRWILTGRAPGLDGRGAGVDALVPWRTIPPEGGYLMFVEASLVIDGIGRVTRRWEPGSGTSLRVAEWTGNTADQQLALYQQLGTSEPFLSVVLDTYQFLALHHAESKTMVLKLLNVQIPLGDKVYDLDTWDAMYLEAFEDRKLAKKRVQQYRIPPPPVEQAAPTLVSVDQKLTERGTELEQALQQAGGATNARGTLEARQRVLQMPLPRPTDETEEALVFQIDGLETRIAQIESEAHQSAGAPVAQPVSMLTVQIGKLRAHVPAKGCIMDSQVPCKTTPTMFSKRIKDLEKQVAAAPVPTTDEPAAVSLTRERARLKTLHLALVRWVGQEQERARELEEVTAQLAETPDTTAIDQRVVELREAIRKGREIRARAEAYWKATDAHQQGATEAQALQAEATRLEGLCEVLGPNGARVTALAARLAEFETAINGYLTPFGWVVGFVLEPWGVTVNGHPIQAYSKSEQYRIGIAIQLAVAQLSGLNFAVVDELDVLLEGPRTTMQRVLFQSPVDQILILAAREPNRPLPGRNEQGQVVPEFISYRVAETPDGAKVVEAIGV